LDFPRDEVNPVRLVGDLRVISLLQQ
jgi:hypothetical protein